MTAQLAPLGRQKFFDNNGNPLALGFVYTYQAGTLIPQASYIDSTQTTQNQNPQQLDFRGEMPLWLDPTLGYKVNVTDQFGNQIPGWPVDNIPGGAFVSPTGSITIPSNLIPSVNNTFTLGNLSFSWANAYLGPNRAPIFDTVSGNIGYYARTLAEIAASVTPANFVYPSIIMDIRRFGGIADNSTDNSNAITKAIAVLTQLVGGTLLFPDTGIYKTSGTITMPGNVKFQGAGMQATVLNYTGSGTFITFTSTGGGNDIDDMKLLGTGKTGIGVQFGDATSFAGLCNMRRVWVRGFATGIRMGGALWATIEDGRIDLNTVGIDFNASFASGHCNVVEIARNLISFNDHEGIAASNVPVRNQSIRLIGGSCEQNGVTDLTRYQFVTGAVEQLTIDNVYFEYAAAGTKPNGINLNGASNFAIRECFFNTLSTAISATAANNGKIETCRFIGTITNDINLTAGPNVHDISADSTNTFSGIGNIYGGANVWIDVGIVQNTTWPVSPTLKGSTVAGTPVYTAQVASCTKSRNLVFFQLRLSISAKTGISGNLTIENVPFLSVTQAGVATIFAAEMSGITVSGGNTYLYAELASNSTSIQLMQGGSTAAVQLTDANLGAAATIQISGCYQAAT